MQNNALATFTILFVAIGGPGLASCADYSTQAEAQAAFNANPQGLTRLDRDSDGIPCEGLPGGSTRATTTSTSSSNRTQHVRLSDDSQSVVSPVNVDRHKGDAGRYYFTRWPHRIEDRKSDGFSD